MLIRTGTVAALRAGWAQVEFEPAPSSCGGCQGGRGCGLGPLLNLLKPAQCRFRLELPIEPDRAMRVGDQVRISLPANELLKSTGIAYVLPLSAMLICAWLAGVLLPWGGDLAALFGATAGLGLAGWSLASSSCGARVTLLP
jgi:positive regulator of sigma E activity